MRAQPVQQVNATSDGQTIGTKWRSAHITDHHHALLADALIRTGAEDRSAFREVYALTSNKLFGICITICGDRQGAEDVLQDVYLKVWRCAAAWEPGRGSAMTWLAAIARNRSIDWRRKQAVRHARPLEEAPDIPDTSPCAETRLLSAEVSELLTKCVGTLAPRAREAIDAAFFHDFTYAELAARDGVPLGTMKSLIRRGLARLKDQLEVTKLLAAEGPNL